MSKHLPIRFEPRWRAESVPMRACVERFYDVICCHESRQRSRRTSDYQSHKRAAEAILCNLAVTDIYSRGGGLQPLKLEVRVDTKASQVSKVYGSSFNRILDVAERLQLLTLARNKRFVANRRLRTVSTVTAMEALRAYFPSDLSIADINLVGRESVIQLRATRNKDGYSERLPLPRSSEIRQMSNAVRDMNAWLADLPVTLEGEQVWSRGSNDGRLQLLTSTRHAQLHRVFQDGSTQFGGRLYGAYWVNMPKTERRERMRIGGERIAHVDYRQCNLRLAYAGYQRKWPFDGNFGFDDVDPYVADNYGDRGDWKQLTNALFFARGPLRQYPGSFEERSDMRARFGRDAKSVYAAIRKRHTAIGCAFESGAGFALERMESGLLMRLMSRLRSEGIPCLPVHDAVIAPLSRASRVADIMTDVARQFLGVPLPTSIE